MQANIHEDFGGYCKGISGFIQYWESLRVVDVGGLCWHRYRSEIEYWTCVCATLAYLHLDSPLTLRHRFGLQTCVDVQALEASLLGNEKVREELDVDDHYIGRANDCPPSSFFIAVYCYECYMLILRLEDDIYAKSVWVAKALSKLNFATSNLHF